VLANRARTTGYDLTALGPRDPLPDLPAEAATRQGHGALGNVRRLLEQSAPADVGEFAELVALRQTGAILAGSPLAVADELERWLAAPDAIDGFVLDPVFFPSGADLLLDELIPELQRRGLFRNAYEGETLREDLGLPPLSVLAGSVYRASGLAEAS
jgi:alkanesulfonate monooxygenase